MLCSICNENEATIFMDRIGEDGKPTGETIGVCKKCAKERGIEPLAKFVKQLSNMSEDDVNEMSEQVNKFMNNLGISEEDIENFENSDDMDTNSKPFGFANLFGGFMPFKNKKSNDETDSKSTDKTKNSTIKVKRNRKTKYLDTYGENLTRKARENKIDKVIGREAELERMIQILNRRSKNNPALIGEPGVGKTAIVNALAIAIANEQVPSKLLSKEIYMLDMTSLVAGTPFRGKYNISN